MSGEHHKGHRERLRRKFVAAGAGALHDYELVELLLTYAIPMKDVKPVAKDLLNRHGGLAELIDASPEELRRNDGIGMNSAILISLVKSICCEYLALKMRGRDTLSSPESVADFARMKLGGLKEEHLMVVYLDTKNQVNNYEIIQRGTVDQAFVYPRNIIKRALANDACGIIIIHNHPSGMCEPSQPDIDLTKSIKDAAETVNIKLVDHMVVGKTGYFSFVRNGLL